MRLEARNLSFRYTNGTRQVLNHVELTVESGERVGIMAPSGFGKTTLCKILAGYERPDEGEVVLSWRKTEEAGKLRFGGGNDGESLCSRRSIENIRGYCPVQMVWQHPELSVNPKRRLKTVLAEGDWPPGQSEFRERILRELGILKEWEERYPVEVSGGELQRFCIARALGARTELLIADEITTMLDLVTQGQIWSFLLKELKERGIGLIAVSHSPELLEKVCDRIVRLSDV